MKLSKLWQSWKLSQRRRHYIKLPEEYTKGCFCETDDHLPTCGLLELPKTSARLRRRGFQRIKRRDCGGATIAVWANDKTREIIRHYHEYGR